MDLDKRRKRGKKMGWIGWIWLDWMGRGEEGSCWWMDGWMDYGNWKGQPQTKMNVAATFGIKTQNFIIKEFIISFIFGIDINIKMA
jgi:hypothetical protein